MKHLLATLAISVLAIPSGFAQVGEVEERKIGGNTGDARDYLLQNLTPQELSRLQSQQTVGNVNSIVQSGNSNLAIIQQVGAGNVTELTQDGNGNEFHSQIVGNNNLNIIVQEGNNNRLIKNINADGHIYKITQQGQGNELRQSEVGTIQSVPVEITQRGQGMQISITNGRID